MAGLEQGTALKELIRRLNITKLGQKRTTPRKALKKGRKQIGRRGLRDKADILFSKAVRAGGKCEYCGKSNLVLHCHHAVVGRRYLNTRYEWDNCICLCASCHRFFEDFASINTEFMKKKIGTKRVEELEALAMTIKPEKFNYEAVIKKLSG